MREQYKAMSMACGIKVGDEVRVLYETPDHHMGWENSWVGQMRGRIGDVMTVRNINHTIGVGLSDGYDYPCFALEKIKPAEPKEPEIKAGSYTCEFFGNGSVEVGCTTVDFDTVKAIYKRAKKARKTA